MKINSPTKFECDFCSSNEYRVKKNIKKRLGIHGNKYEIVECAKCRLTSLFPQPEQHDIENFYENYDIKKNRAQTESIRQKEIYPYKIKNLKYYTGGRRLLDIGAGLGTFAFMAQQEGFSITGIELSRHQCKMAKKKFGLDFMESNIFEIKNDIGKFDVIHLHHVMEHLTSPSKMFDILQDLLTQEGVLLIEVPYQLKMVQELIKKRKFKKRKFNFDHLFFFSPKTMKNFLSRKGFQIIRFQQHRPEKFEGNILHFYRYYLRLIFRRLTSALLIPSGTFIEFYCKKK